MTARMLVAWLACITLAHAGEGPLPSGLAGSRDLRGIYRAALCNRADMTADLCANALRSYEGETPAERPPPAAAERYRLLFVPGFMASCFPLIHSFEDAADAARKAGYAAEVVPVGGRNGIAANADIIARSIEALPADGRRLVLIGHSKGANDILEVLGTRPDLASRVDAVLTVAGALQGSPLAEDLHFAYEYTLGVLPLPSCEQGQGDPVADLRPATREQWWKTVGAALRTPIYSLVTLPDLDRLSPGLVMAYTLLSRYSSDNDGMLRPQDQVASPGRLLGVVNADHLSVAIPFPGYWWVFVFTATSFPRPQAVLAALDVISAERP